MTENECIEKLEIFPKWNMEDLWLDADDMEDLVSTCIKAIKEVPGNRHGEGVPGGEEKTETGDTRHLGRRLRQGGQHGL